MVGGYTIEVSVALSHPSSRVGDTSPFVSRQFLSALVLLEIVTTGYNFDFFRLMFLGPCLCFLLNYGQALKKCILNGFQNTLVSVGCTFPICGLHIMTT